MSDEESIDLIREAFGIGLKMRAAIIEEDTQERKDVRTEWETFHRENIAHHADIFLAYRRGLESL